MADTRVTLSGWTLDNPVIPASGTFGYGGEYRDWYDPNILGTFSCKGTTLHPREGNDLPRIAETPQGMLNAIGLQNPGVHAVVDTELPRLRAFYHKKIIANVSGFSVEEYQQVSMLLDREDIVGLLEVNISCPNVRHGGMAFGTTAEGAYRVTRAVKEAVQKPVYMKLSPNVTDIAEIALACKEGGADGLSLINTILGMRIDLRTRKPILGNTFGGLSGRALFPVALGMVWKVRRATGLPVIGMGGVASARDVLEMMMAGASAVEIGAENLVNPLACKQIIEQLPIEMEKLGIERLADITGGANP